MGKSQPCQHSTWEPPYMLCSVIPRGYKGVLRLHPEGTDNLAHPGYTPRIRCITNSGANNFSVPTGARPGSCPVQSTLRGRSPEQGPQANPGPSRERCREGTPRAHLSPPVSQLGPSCMGEGAHPWHRKVSSKVSSSLWPWMRFHPNPCLLNTSRKCYIQPCSPLGHSVRAEAARWLTLCMPDVLATCQMALSTSLPC